jgi:ABC-2 type transport system permease protein
VIRAFVSGIRVQLLQLLRSPFDLTAIVVWPIIYSSIAYYLLDVKQAPRLLLYAALGAAVMVMWSHVVVGAADALELMRFTGTLELMAAAPIPLVTILAPVMLTTALFGLYGLVVTLVWGRLAFDVPLVVAHPLAFALSIPVCVIAIGALGLIVASSFVLYRAAFALGVAMQYPVWIASGLLIGLSILPHWVTPISWLLAPSWGFQAIERAAVGGDPWPAIGMCLALGAAYTALGVVTVRNFERLARDRAALSLT